ncbi:universal stress protein [Rubinisphaera margarita]|uniref:universal stress protein n=1 Tax=Rubinisphaera margarita TaxID=2909586 RepID=UPI001EE81EBA|nr:universal stress protein [Rubinisphaera margarita]MCG6156857.1 universal stress protein [Rubinisphaera margarita]
MTWLPKKSVVVPIDFSEESRPAIETALELVARPEHVHAIHVMFPLDIISPGVAWGVVDEAERETVTKEHTAKYIEEHNFTGVTVLNRVGDPGTEIADYAADINADLIIIPSHGYHGIKRALLGSVAERVIRHAHCPVLVLRRHDAD